MTGVTRQISRGSTLDTDDDEASKKINNPVSLRVQMGDLLENQLGRFTTPEEDELLIPFDVRFFMLVSQYTDEAIQQAVLLRALGDEDETSPSYTGRLPLHLACDKRASTDVIRWLVEHDVHKESLRRADAWGDLPLHTACSRQNYEQVIQLLVEHDVDKTTLRTKDNNGLLPIHFACRYNLPPQIIQLLLDSDKTTNYPNSLLLEEGTYGQIPLSVACRNNSSPGVFQVLLKYDDEQQTVLMEDDVGRIPLHVAFLRVTDVKILELLLHAMVGGRMDRLGLEQWKRDMRRFVQSMKVHERDFMTREKLNVVSQALQELMECTVLLELAVWRASCLKIGDSLCGSNKLRFSNISDITALGEMDPSFDANAYKQERRIKSGAEEIVRSVMPFLEDYPLEAYKKEFVDSSGGTTT